MAPAVKRQRAGRTSPDAEGVRDLLRLLGEPRPTISVAHWLLDRLGASSGFVLAVESGSPESVAVVGTRGEAPAEGFSALAQAARHGTEALRALDGPPAGVLFLGKSPDVIVATTVGTKTRVSQGRVRRQLESIQHEISAAVRAALRIEKLEASEAALAHAGREKEEFTGFLLHDLRNPLTVALTNLEYLRETGTVTDVEAHAALRDTEDSVSLVVDHLGGLLDIAQLEEARMTCHRQPVNVPDLVRAVLDQFEFTARRREIGLSLECEMARPVALDPDLLRRMMHNLLTTSLRVTPNGGWIRVLARHEGARVTLVVASSGPAVAEEVRPSLFTKYRRLGAGGRSDTHAHGLGLYFVKLAAEAHGGTVRAEGRADGSAFVVELPDREEPRRAAS